MRGYQPAGEEIQHIAEMSHRPLPVPPMTDTPRDSCKRYGKMAIPRGLEPRTPNPEPRTPNLLIRSQLLI